MQYNYLVDIMHTTDESLKTAIHRIDRESDNKILACLYSQSRGIEDLHVMGFGLTTPFIKYFGLHISKGHIQA